MAHVRRVVRAHALRLPRPGRRAEGGLLTFRQRIWIVSSLALLAGLAAFAADAEPETETRSYELSREGVLRLTVPASWHERVEPVAPEDGVATLNLQYETDDPSSWVVAISVLWNVDHGIDATDAELRAEVETSLEQLRGHVVEDSAPLLGAEGDDVRLYYFSVTDTQPEAGGYAFMTRGAGRIGRVLVSFSILSNERRETIERRALEVLRTARHERENGP